MSFDYIEESFQQPENHSIGEDWWNRSKESRKHPELYSSGHGTVDVPWSLDDEEYKHAAVGTEGGEQTSHHTEKKMEKLLSNGKEKEQDHQGQVGIFGHTMKKHKYTVRSIHRDLNNV